MSDKGSNRQAGEVSRNRGERRSVLRVNSNQREILRDTMLRAKCHGLWLTLHEVSRLTLFGEASISAQLRHLRKRKHGGFQVEKRRRRSAEVRRTGRLAPVWEYQLWRARRRRRARRESQPGGRTAVRGTVRAASQVS